MTEAGHVQPLYAAVRADGVLSRFASRGSVRHPSIDDQVFSLEPHRSIRPAIRCQSVGGHRFAFFVSFGPELSGIHRSDGNLSFLP